VRSRPRSAGCAGPGGARPDAARASYADGLGHPVAFRRPAWARLLSLTGDAGARHLLEDLEVVHVRVPGDVPTDVDTPADLRRVQAGGGEGGGARARAGSRLR
jgi:molybdenum cofactor cytidylyltransferase